MRDYELIAIIKDEEIVSGEIQKKIKTLLESKSLKIKKEEVWGSRTLAYPVKNETTGYYIIYQIEGDYKNIKPVEEALRIEDNILRFRLFRDNPVHEPKKTKKGGKKWQ